MEEVRSKVKNWISEGDGALDNPADDVERLLGSAYLSEDWKTIFTDGQEILEDFDMINLLDRVDGVCDRLNAKAVAKASRMILHVPLSRTHYA